MAEKDDTVGGRESLTGSGFEKRGGFISKDKPPVKLPVVAPGPGPGSQNKSQEGQDKG